jgi:hypothetical protein
MNKVTNYNMSYHLLVDALQEFEKFIPGGAINNRLFSYIPKSSGAYNAKLARPSVKTNVQLDKFSKAVLD